MNRSLREIEGCFQGAIPAYFATVDADGQPNVTALSVVHLLDASRVGLSCQFMKKTLANLESTGRGQLLVMEPSTLREYLLDLEYRSTITQGDVFDKVDAHLAGVASQTGMEDVFGLQSVLEFEVTAWCPAGDAASGPELSGPSPVDPLALLDHVAAALQAATDLDALLEQTFTALEQHLGLSHGFLLLADPEITRLYTVASHGFNSPHFGAEVAVGEGIYGVVAERLSPSRHGSLTRDRIMSHAIARESESSDPTSLALPGLPNAESSMAIPLTSGGRCMGVLCFQSPEPAAFSETQERMASIVARHLAAMIEVLKVGENSDVEVSGRRGPIGSRALLMRIKYFESDGSIFVDDQYLIKGVAGRILWSVVQTYVHEQREDFSNKEIRLDQSLGLPAIKDNLEARLIALRKRLEERTHGLRIDKTGRGRFRLQVDRELQLERND